MALTADEVHAALDELLAEVCRRHGRSARTPSSRRLTVSGSTCRSSCTRS